MTDKSNFAQMDNRELRKYVLEHRDDAEAFQALVDQLKANPNRVRVGADEDATPYIQKLVEREEARKRQNQS